MQRDFYTTNIERCVDNCREEGHIFASLYVINMFVHLLIKMPILHAWIWHLYSIYHFQRPFLLYHILNKLIMEEEDILLNRMALFMNRFIYPFMWKNDRLGSFLHWWKLIISSIYISGILHLHRQCPLPPLGGVAESRHVWKFVAYHNLSSGTEDGDWCWYISVFIPVKRT